MKMGTASSLSPTSHATARGRPGARDLNFRRGGANELCRVRRIFSARRIARPRDMSSQKARDRCFVGTTISPSYARCFDRGFGPRAWRSRTRVDARVVGVRLLPDGSRWSGAHVEAGPSERGLPAGVYLHPGVEPTYEADVGTIEGQATDEPVQLLDLVQSVDGRSIRGTIRVRNLAFQKRVYVRYTLDGWASQADAFATFRAAVGRSHDEFTYRLDLPSVGDADEAKPVVMQLAVGFECAGSEFWDNRAGLDYTFTLEPARSEVRRLDRRPRRPREPVAPEPGSAEEAAARTKAAEEEAFGRPRSLAARFFATERGRDTLDRSCTTPTSRLPKLLRYNADLHAPVWLVGQSDVDESVVYAPTPPIQQDRPIGDTLRFWRRLRPASPWRPLLIEMPSFDVRAPSASASSTSSAPSSSACSAACSSASSSPVQGSSAPPFSSSPDSSDRPVASARPRPRLETPLQDVRRALVPRERR